MASFSVIGPIDVPVKRGKGGRSIDNRSSALKGFWTAAGCGSRAGCYVFGIKHGRGTTPYYAGRTDKTLVNECFQSHKLTKYNDALISVARGKPVLYFVVPVVERGRPNSIAIKALEERLIALGMQRNPEMRNIQGTKKTEIVIKGVIGSGRGKPTRSATSFRKMVGL